jgi:hypothetical protein
MGSRGPLCVGRQSLKSDAVTEHTQTIETFIIYPKTIHKKTTYQEPHETLAVYSIWLKDIQRSTEAMALVQHWSPSSPQSQKYSWRFSCRCFTDA